MGLPSLAEVGPKSTSDTAAGAAPGANCPQKPARLTDETKILVYDKFITFGKLYIYLYKFLYFTLTAKPR